MVSADISKNIAKIDIGVFEGCSKLININIPQTMTKIPDNMFSGCESLKTIELHEGVTEIGHCAFEGCKSLESIVIPDSVTNIRYGAFERCINLSAISIPANVGSIGELGDSISFWGNTGRGEDKNVFAYCDKLESITVSPENTTYNDGNGSNAIIETETNSLITGCSKTVIPIFVTVLKKESFIGCTGLESITIPDNIMDIESYVFDKCSNLKTIFIGKGSYAENWAKDARNFELSKDAVFKYFDGSEVVFENGNEQSDGSGSSSDSQG